MLLIFVSEGLSVCTYSVVVVDVKIEDVDMVEVVVGDVEVAVEVVEVVVVVLEILVVVVMIVVIGGRRVEIDESGTAGEIENWPGVSTNAVSFSTTSTPPKFDDSSLVKVVPDVSVGSENLTLLKKFLTGLKFVCV